MNDYYKNCRLCPRNCGVNRYVQKGYCGEGAELRIATASIHRGEEPPVTGKGGSGTIFITGCNLGCNFCQNYQISQEAMGRAVSGDEFAEICLRLAGRGAENINLVTGSHVVPSLIEGIALARERGLAIPVLWNSSGYDGLEALELLAGAIDAWLPDLKTLDAGLAGRFFRATDYPDAAKAALLKMAALVEKRLSQNKALDAAGLQPCLIVRHLVLPGHLEASRDVFRWYAENLNGRPGVLLSVMTQYTPIPSLSSPAPASFLNEAEYDAVINMLEEYGIDDGFCQELVTDSSWLPDFRRTNPFSTKLSSPVWHWKHGFVA
jgi:putative pyruvate formate lyase activating enzyme